MKGIYLHIPFCDRKCFYCDFYSVENIDLMNQYLDSLLREIELYKPFIPEKTIIDTIFLGGGTPSIIDPIRLKIILNKLKEFFNISLQAEITIECNPGMLSESNLLYYKEIGINRISIGVQSFVDSELLFLQRIHNSRQAEEAILLARKAGFDNISIDLIFSIPGQTMESLDYSIGRAIELKPEHISAYSLIFEDNTPLYNEWKSGKINKTFEDDETELYLHLIERLQVSGYNQYEVSNFALNGRKCRHNINYWNGSEYYGFGASAHGYLSEKRYSNVRSIVKYIKYLDAGMLPVDFTEELTEKQKQTERVYLSLRAEGLNTAEYHREFGVNIIKSKFNDLKAMEKEGLLIIEGDTIRLQPKGYCLSEEVAMKLM
ncbi:MAG: Heme chaperone HemW [Bacteroidota bacterium]|nr:Heme chaperone HemW [Bacteroidota bacterium]